MKNTESQKKRKKLSDTLTYAYLRRIKRKMLCPACREDMMTLDGKSAVWQCGACGYQLSADESEDDYVFWFCDACDAYLNNQEGFDRQALSHVCQNCGHENFLTFDNINGICSDCGRELQDPDATLCADCRQIRRKKKGLLMTGVIVGAAAAGAVYFAVRKKDDRQ